MRRMRIFLNLIFAVLVATAAHAGQKVTGNLQVTGDATIDGGIYGDGSHLTGISTGTNWSDGTVLNMTGINWQQMDNDNVVIPAINWQEVPAYEADPLSLHQYDNNGVIVADFSSPYRIFYDASGTEMMRFSSGGAAPKFLNLSGAGPGFVKADNDGALSLDPGTYITGIDGTMVTTALGFTPYDSSNPAGFITGSGYFPSMSVGNADSAWSASYASYASNSDYATYVMYENDPTFMSVPYDGTPYGYQAGTGWVQVLGDTTFTQFRGGTAYTIDTAVATELNDGASRYSRLTDYSHGNVAEFSDGTNTFTIGGTSGISYVGGATDFVAGVNATSSIVQTIEAGTLTTPFFYQNTKDSVDTVIPFGVLSRKTTGMAAAGLGGSLDFQLTNDAGSQVKFGSIDFVATDVTAGSEKGVVAINNPVRISSLPTGTLVAPPSGLVSGDLWADTTTSATHPIVRVKL